MPSSAAQRLRAASFLVVAVVLAAVGTARGASAEVKKLMTLCPGQKLCAWFQSTVTPPKGRVEDKDAGEQNHVTILLPDKDDVDFNDPMTTSRLPTSRVQTRSTRSSPSTRRNG